MTFSPYVLGTGIAGWNFLDRTRTQQQQIFEKSPILDRAVKDFTNKIDSIQTADQLLDDYNVLQVALGA
ncbi:MAG: flagellar protein, partial [Pseudomonadota bacterium]|nr:flagellar protein [Pseudomonadota bacterium]